MTNDKIPMTKRQPMPQQVFSTRVKNFNEVNLGYSKGIAILEASRCLLCPKPLCVVGCPVGVDIPGFIKLIKLGDFCGAVKIIKQTNPLPAICGRVCPWEKQCESSCIIGKKGESVAIGNLERFIGDYGLAHSLQPKAYSPQPAQQASIKVAVIGSGPSGLAAAGELTKMGYGVTIFEALHKAGGVLTYGIPNFRLPKEIVEKEIDYLKILGVNIQTNTVVGRTITIDELFLEDFKAVFIGSGAGLPVFMNIPDENLNGIYSANEFLTRVNLMKAYLFPEYATPIIVGKKVAVIGGGDTVLDAARTAIRLSPETVSVIYRRSIGEMPARKEEIEHSREEGIQFQFLTGPVKFIGDESGWIKAMECIKMELGKEDEDGRRRAIPIKGSEFLMDTDTLIIAIGNEPHPLLARTTPGLIATNEGTLIIDKSTMMTSKQGVFAGGDIITGGATVIEAMGQGKKAALAIDAYVKIS